MENKMEFKNVQTNMLYNQMKPNHKFVIRSFYQKLGFFTFAQFISAQDDVWDEVLQPKDRLQLYLDIAIDCLN